MQDEPFDLAAYESGYFIGGIETIDRILGFVSEGDDSEAIVAEMACQSLRILAESTAYAGEWPTALRSSDMDLSLLEQLRTLDSVLDKSAVASQAIGVVDDEAHFRRVLIEYLLSLNLDEIWNIYTQPFALCAHHMELRTAEARLVLSNSYKSGPDLQACEQMLKLLTGLGYLSE